MKIKEKIFAYIRYFRAIILMQVLKLFWIFPVDDKSMLFLSFDGNQYSDSPKYLCEYIKENKGMQYKYIWAINDERKYLDVPDWAVIVPRHSIKFLLSLTRSRYIVTNNSLYVYYPIRKSQIVLNTWHGGSPLKTCGLDDEQASFYHKLFFKLQNKKYTAYLSSSRFMTETVFRGSLAFDGTVLEYGMPRNAVLFNDHEKIKRMVYKHFGIEYGGDVGIILYAPTFRRDNRSATFLPADQMLDIEHCINVFNKKYNKKFVLMFRAHYTMHINEDFGNCILASNYPDMQELLCAADILITDYSSCMGDMALMRKPVFLYVPDLEEYTKDRGFYWNIHDLPFPIVKRADQLKAVVDAFDKSEYDKKVDQYLCRLGSFESGDSTQKAFSWLMHSRSCQ